MSTWNTTSTNSRFGSTGVGPAIEGSSSTAWRSKQSPSIPSCTSPWSNVPRGQRVRPQPVGAKTGNLSEVNNHLASMSTHEILFSANPKKVRVDDAVRHLADHQELYWAVAFRVATERLSYPMYGYIHISGGQVEYRVSIRDIVPFS